MTPLAEHIKDLIRADGPISVAEYMRLVLSARDDSYYRQRDAIGARGDFVTAPEVSQIFGELIGLWCVDVWQQLGAPPRVQLVELGPGRGTLMKDALRAARVAPAFLAATSVVLVEISETLRGCQRETFERAAVPVQWIDKIEDLGARDPVIVIANELFDALPIRQWVRTVDGWRERCVGLDANDELAFGASPDRIEVQLVPVALRDAPVGSIVEAALARSAAARLAGERVSALGGAVLVIDYGFAGPATGDTFQAIKAHAFVDVLREPGAADLTSHVDFSALRDAFREGGAVVSSLATQGAFLERLGGRARVAALQRSANATQRSQIDEAYDRLTGAKAMGSLFKVLAAYSPSTLQPAGFADV